MGGALKDIRILDLSRVLAGPFCTQMLGDLGAEILKIEKPGAGDDTRYWGPPFLKDSEGNDTTESAYYLSANRNKKSVAIDIKTPQGQALIKSLIAKSDVVIENFKVGGLKKYGLSYDQLKEEFPHIVYCSITGYGQYGPIADEPGYDFVAQGMAGLMACTGEPGEAPMKVGVALSDIMTGLNAAVGILAALHGREKTGKGQMVDLSLIDCTIASLSNIAQYYLTSRRTSPRLGNAHGTIVPYQAFETTDGYIILAVGNNEQFARYCEFIGKSEWASDERFAKNRDRVLNRDILVPMIRDVMKEHSTAYWLEGLRDANVPCGPVNTMDQVFAEPQVQAREMEIKMDHDFAPDEISLVGSPFKLSDTAIEYKQAPPYLGQHTIDVLEKVLDLSADEIAQLKDQNVIGIAKT